MSEGADSLALSAGLDLLNAEPDLVPDRNISPRHRSREEEAEEEETKGGGGGKGKKKNGKPTQGGKKKSAAQIVRKSGGGGGIEKKKKKLGPRIVKKVIKTVRKGLNSYRGVSHPSSLQLAAQSPPPPQPPPPPQSIPAPSVASVKSLNPIALVGALLKLIETNTTPHNNHTS